MPIHEERMAVISTAHLPECEANTIESMIAEGDVTGMSREEGWLVHTHDYVADRSALSYVLGYLKAKSYDWVLFDRDAAATDELPTYGW